MSNKNKNILLGVLIVGVISMTIAFAALSTNLRINGITNVAATRWNIHFQNWEKVSIPTVTIGGNTQTNNAQSPAVNQLTMQDNSNVTKVSDVNVTLNGPGDTAKYTFEIINEGTIDAKLDDFTVTDTTNNNLVDYQVKCYESSSLTGTEVDENSVLSANGGLAYCYLQVTYKEQTNNNTAGSNQRYTQSAVSTSVSAQWTWVQNDGSSAQSGGGNTPSNPYETTFDGNYIAYKWYDVDNSTPSYDESNVGDGWRTTLNPNSTAYLRTTGSLPEVCGVFGSGQARTVCSTSSYYNSSYSSAGNYNADFADVSTSTYNITTISGLEATGLKGYALAKATEMLTKGAFSCGVYRDGVYCYSDDDVDCGILNNGNVDCRGAEGDYVYVSVNNDGSTH